MMRPSARRTRGMAKNMVGAAIAQAIIHELSHISNIVRSQPSTRQVATPVTRKVMKKLVPNGRANLKQKAGSFFTTAGTIWYGLGRRPSLSGSHQHVLRPAVPDRQAARCRGPEEEDRLPRAARSLP